MLSLKTSPHADGDAAILNEDEHIAEENAPKVFPIRIGRHIQHFSILNRENPE
mgnify:CR=1 FL=1